MESPRHLLYELPDDVLQYIVAYCVPRTMWTLRGVNRALRKITARLAWRRALSKDASMRWLHDPTFQAQVAATMAHPERDLYVYVRIPDAQYYAGSYVYSLSAAAKVCLQGWWNPVSMPCLRVDGPIAHLELAGVSYASQRLVGCEHCAAIWLTVKSLNEIDGQLPRELRELHVTNAWWEMEWEDVRRFVASQQDIGDDAMVYLYRMTPSLTMRWRNFRRLFIAREPIRIGLAYVVSYDGTSVTCVEHDNVDFDFEFDEPETWGWLD